MSKDCDLRQAISVESSTDLETVLAAWHTATIRLEQTHEALRSEVHRLTDELEEKNRELARKHRLGDLGQMAAHVAHEVRNKLVPVTLYLSLLRRRIQDDPGSLKMLDNIEAGFTGLEVTITDLLSFTTDRDPHIRTFPLAKLVEDVYASLGPQLSAQEIEIITEIDETQQVTADRDMLRRAVLNLVLNSLDVMPDGGTLTVRASEGPKGTELTVSDTGPGMPDDTRRRAFEPFYSTKPGGTGLGLTIVYRVAEVHGGEVVAANRPERGAVLTLRIPQPAQEAAA